MKKYKVLATPRSFAATDPAPVQLLEENDCEVIRLPTNGHIGGRSGGVFAGGRRDNRRT